MGGTEDGLQETAGLHEEGGQEGTGLGNSGFKSGAGGGSIESSKTGATEGFWKISKIFQPTHASLETAEDGQVLTGMDPIGGGQLGVPGVWTPALGWRAHTRKNLFRTCFQIHTQRPSYAKKPPPISPPKGLHGYGGRGGGGGKGDQNRKIHRGIIFCPKMMI